MSVAEYDGGGSGEEMSMARLPMGTGAEIKTLLPREVLLRA